LVNYQDFECLSFAHRASFLAHTLMAYSIYSVLSNPGSWTNKEVRQFAVWRAERIRIPTGFGW